MAQYLDVDKRVGWQNAPESELGRSSMSFEQSLVDSRHHRLVYAHVISDELSSNLERYVAVNNDITDLTSEMAILRHLMAEELIRLDGCRNIDNILKQEAARLVYTSSVREILRDIERLAVSISRIKTQREGKLDLVVLNGLVTAISRSVDVGLQQFESGMRRGGTDPQEVADAISGLVGQAVNELMPNQQLAIGNSNVLTKPTQLTSDMLVSAMDNVHVNAGDDVLLGGAIASLIEDAEAVAS